MKQEVKPFHARSLGLISRDDAPHGSAGAAHGGFSKTDNAVSKL